jgi:hypothetical protein
LVLSVAPRGSRPDGDALHANTAANALHYAFGVSTRTDTRLLLLLQALAWMPMYGNVSKQKQRLTQATDITSLTGAKLPSQPEAAIEQVLATRTDSPAEASRLAFAFGQRHGVEPLLRAARRLVPAKCTGDAHDIKFPVAIFEDVALISPAWRPHLLAAAVYSFWGSDRPDNPVMEAVREAVGRG